jgi:hypothetical protein
VELLEELATEVRKRAGSYRGIRRRWTQYGGEPSQVVLEPGVTTSVPLGVLREWAEAQHDH